MIIKNALHIQLIIHLKIKRKLIILFKFNHIQTIEQKRPHTPSYHKHNQFY